jgi:hypothetical protein
MPGGEPSAVLRDTVSEGCEKGSPARSNSRNLYGTHFVPGVHRCDFGKVIIHVAFLAKTSVLESRAGKKYGVIARKEDVRYRTHLLRPLEFSLGGIAAATCER